jgi:hypothetical protein
MRKHLGTMLIMLAFFAVFSACAGIVRLQQTPREVQVEKLEDLVARWEAHDVYATIWRGAQVRAIIFDPKDDSKQIIADRWVKVQSKEELSRFLAHMEAGHTPRLFSILGPQESFFGYIYTVNVDIQTQMVNEQTIRVYEIKPPSAPAA